MAAPHQARSIFDASFQEPGPHPQPLPRRFVANLHEISLAFRPEERKHDFNRPFISQFISSRGNEYFCEIDEEYLTDRFNLTGLNTEVQYYQYALDLITDVFDLDADDDLREQIEKSARHLYGLVHARYIVTTRGLAKMVRPLSRPFARSVEPTLTSQCDGSSRNTRKGTLENALASCANSIRCFPWESPTSPTRRR